MIQKSHRADMPQMDAEDLPVPEISPCIISSGLERDGGGGGGPPTREEGIMH
jgi:hypothetical protein